MDSGSHAFREAKWQGIFQRVDSRHGGRRIHALVFLGILFGGLTLGAKAQQDPAIQLRQEMQQRQREESLQTLPSEPVLTEQPALQAHPEEVAEPEPLLHAPAITVQGNGLLDDETIASVTAPYRSLDLGRHRITLLMRQLNAQLVMRGLVTSRARIARMDARDNALAIDLVPGRIEDYASAGQPVEPEMRRAFPGEPQDLLVLQDVEQGVQQIQRLRRYQAELRILPGQTPDVSLIDVRLTEDKPWWFQFAADNLGSKSTGRERARATLALENTLGFLEGIGLTYLRSRDSEAAVATLAIPFGYNTLSASYAASRYTQDLPADLQEKGGSHTGTVAWNRVLHLSAAGRDAAELSLTYSDSWRKIDAYTLTPEQLTVLKASFVSIRQGNGWRAWGEFDVSRGLPWFGANSDSGQLPSAWPHAQFTKYEAHGGLIFQPASGIGQYIGQIDAQISRVGLYSTEQFRLGGMSTVRGYDEGLFSGDKGFLLRNEWQAAPWAIKAADAQAAPLLFADYGAARQIDSDIVRLAGAGAGLRFAGKRWNSEILAAKPVYHSAGIHNNSWHAYLTFRIDL